MNDTSSKLSSIKKLSEKKVSEIVSAGLLELIEEQPQPIVPNENGTKIVAASECGQLLIVVDRISEMIFGVCNKV